MWDTVGTIVGGIVGVAFFAFVLVITMKIHARFSRAKQRALDSFDRRLEERAERRNQE